MFKKVLKVGVTLVLICTLLPTSVYAETIGAAGSTLQSSTEATGQEITGGTEATNTVQTPGTQSTENTSQVQNTEKTTEVQSTEKSSEALNTEALTTEKNESTEKMTNTESAQTPTTETVTEPAKNTDKANTEQPKVVTEATGSAVVDDTSTNQDELVDESYLNAAVSQRADSDGDADLPSFLQSGEAATGISGSQTLNPSSAKVSDVASIMQPIIYTNEVGSSWSTRYGSVNPNDNGYGISAGILQWNATNALDLLKKIIAASDAAAKQTLGTTLYNKIKSDTSWAGTNIFVPSATQASAIGRLLASSAGVSVQDSLANAYIYSYLDVGYNTYKLRNASALAYFCDIKNQCGNTTVGRITNKAIQLAGGDPAYVTLNEMHEAAIMDSVAGNYLSRRYLTYDSIANALSARGWSFNNSGTYRIPANVVKSTTDSSAIKWLQWALNSTIQSGLAVDGGYGSLTTAAVKDFQSKNGLTSDGYAGQQTIVTLVRVLDSKGLLTFHSNSISSVVPTGIKVKNTTSGVKVSWSAVAKANGYIIYRKVNGGKYANIGTVQGGSTTSFADATATSGTTYLYRIKAFNDTSKSAYSSAVSISCLQAPTLKKVTVTTNGLKLSWAKTKGATGYYIYRKNGGSYSKIATLTNGSAASYTDNTVKNKKAYTYTVKAYNGTTTSTYISTGVSGTYLSAPALKKASATVKGVKVSWAKTSGAAGYTIYRKTNKGSYSKIATITGGTKTSFTDTTAKNKTTYIYTVRAFNNVTTSSYDSKGVTIYYLKAPVLKSASLASKGIKVSWEKVSGAAGYSLYRKTSGSGYKKIKDITSGTTVSYTDTTVSNNKSYIYTVRAIKGNASSSYNTGVSQTYVVSTKKMVKSTQSFFNGPGQKYTAVGMLSKGAKVYVANGYSKIANGYSWSKIYTKNAFYYLPSKYLKNL